MKHRIEMISKAIFAQTILLKFILSFLMTLLLVVSAKISFHMPITPVPVTLQVAAVLLSGMLLGPVWGSLAIVQYMIVGLLGAPVFADNVAGPAVIFRPSFGYIMGFLPGAFLAGILTSQGERTVLRGLIAAFSGILIIYFFGMLWLAVSYMVSGTSIFNSISMAFSHGIMPFIVVDSIKALLSAGVWASVPSRSASSGGK